MKTIRIYGPTIKKKANKIIFSAEIFVFFCFVSTNRIKTHLFPHSLFYGSISTSQLNDDPRISSIQEPTVEIFLDYKLIIVIP